MSRVVVDASVVAAAFFQEAHAEHAAELLSSDAELHAPDFIDAELANVIWKRYRSGDVDLEVAQRIYRDHQRIPWRRASVRDLTHEALLIAIDTDRTVYDCLYLALAVRQNCEMITADRRLVNSLQNTPLQKHIAWIG